MINGWRKPWNYELKSELTPKEQRAIKNLSWAEQSHTINEVGSTFSIQGFDLNYAGVILGPSVKYRNGKIIFDPNESCNTKAIRNRTLSDGSKKLMDFLDEQRMCRLYEKFILEYYRKEFKNQIVANASQIPWQLDNEENAMLPVMQSDIMLQRGDRVLIIDAKYYEHSMQVQFNKHTLHSANLYQIFTYVKNKEYELREKDHTVSGMLLYAKTDEEIYPNNVYQMSGNQITVRTLDLNLPFTEIAEQLDTIAKLHFSL
jgi:hypothetical protein